MKSQTEVLTVAQLFADSDYTVPIYQRAYAWRDDEIVQLLRDVRDARLRQSASENYYIGTLVVHQADEPSRGRFEVVDGQQRLTTLALVLSHPRAGAVLTNRGVGSPAKSPVARLDFEGRPDSQHDLAEIGRYPDHVYSVAPTREPRDGGIRNGVASIHRVLTASDTAVGSSDVVFEEADIEFLLDHVCIVRTELPSGTDLNHYFEIMNSRGEQLEKHEIVKARLLGREGLTPTDRTAISMIWDACSDLSRYVQQGFPKPFRGPLFGASWDQLAFSNVDTVFAALAPEGSDSVDSGHVRLDELLNGKDAPQATEDEDGAGRYGAIIDFPNFLLHALKLHVAQRDRSAEAKRFSWSSPDGAVSLDDKQLIELFDEHIVDADDARGFVYTLLVTRFLFDNYVIKTDRVNDATEDDSNWVLKRPHRTPAGGEETKAKLSPRDTYGLTGRGSDDDSKPEGTQRRILLLHSMFQVTDSRRAYKNFLFATLEILWNTHKQGTVDGSAFAHELETLATERVTYLLSRPTTTTPSQVIDSGTAVPQFLFNFVDYALWRGLSTGSLTPRDMGGADRTNALPLPLHQQFRFRYRKSIEHFYPVQPSERDGQERLRASIVDRFGNLCVMTVSENSRRNNLAATAKAAQFKSSDESLKFQIMAAMTKADQQWDVAQINEHGEVMWNLLQRPLKDFEG